jgi:hypothetical protein
MRGRLRLWSLLAVAISAASIPAGAQAIRDSAGIQVVDNARPVLTTARAWRIDPVPFVTIGGQSAGSDTMYDLDLVMGIARLRDGRYALGVQASSAIRFYDVQGKFLAAAGRRGQGPGEFQQVMGVKAMRGDTLVVTDLGEIELYSSDGKFVAQGASRSRNGRFVRPSVVLNDGSSIGVLFVSRTPPPTGRRRDSMPLVRVSRDGERVDTISMVLGLEWVNDGRADLDVAFSGFSGVAGDEQRVFVSTPTESVIRQLTLDGKLTRLIRFPHPPLKTSNEAIQAYRAWWLSSSGEDGRPASPEWKAYREKLLERQVFAEELPPFSSSMIVDKAGNLWVQRYDYRSAFYTSGPVRILTIPVTTRWNIVDPSGRWLCVVDLPARFTPVEIGTDYIAGLGRDIDDVEQVRVYRLRKP